MSHKEQPLIPSHPKRILLPRFDTLGDIVLLEGFLESLQELYPQAKRALLVRKGYDTLSPLFDKTIEWINTDIDPQRTPPDFLECEKLIHALGVEEWDMLLATAYNRTWADDLVAARLTGAKRFALGESSDIPSLYRGLFTHLGLSLDCPYDRFITVDETSHETDKYENLWKALGGKSTIPEPRLSVPEQHQKAARRILDAAGLESEGFCLCFPAGTHQISIKAWPPEHFAEMVTWMDKEYHLPSLIAGHESEADCIQEVAHLARKGKVEPRIWLGKDGEIPVFAALAAAAKIYVGNDTGPMHIAAAVKTPVVAIFGGGHWPRFQPRGNRSWVVVGEMPCFGCGWNCIFADAPCVSLVSVKDVQKAVASLYNGSASNKGRNRVIPASMKLKPETKRYIEKAVETHRQIEEDRAARLKDNQRLEEQLKESEEDRAARLKDNQRLEEQLKESEEDRAARLKDNQRLEEQLKESEEDRAARLKDNQRLEEQLKESEEDRAARLEVIRTLESRLQVSEENLTKLKKNKIVRLLIRLGLVDKEKTGEEE